MFAIFFLLSHQQKTKLVIVLLYQLPLQTSWYPKAMLLAFSLSSVFSISVSLLLVSFFCPLNLCLIIDWVLSSKCLFYRAFIFTFLATTLAQIHASHQLTIVWNVGTREAASKGQELGDIMLLPWYSKLNDKQKDPRWEKACHFRLERNCWKTSVAEAQRGQRKVVQEQSSLLCWMTFA